MLLNAVLFCLFFFTVIRVIILRFQVGCQTEGSDGEIAESFCRQTPFSATDSKCERRIMNGSHTTHHKRYVAYFIKASSSPQKYDAWLCGGAIVSHLYIVTSAACIADVQHMYAVIGYKKYVRSEHLDTDGCTKWYKKKVVYTCVPKAYDLDYDRVEKWAYIDIGVVKVESAIHFHNTEYERYCSYRPHFIGINYEQKYQEPGLDAFVLGYGHAEQWRHTFDKNDYNHDLLYTTTLLQEKEVCKKAYSHIPKMAEIIDKYMICTNGSGNINDAGEVIRAAKPMVNGCETKDGRVENPKTCANITNQVDKTDATYDESLINDLTRRSGINGICQNDHGGPLVTWAGSHEILIGVASVFRVNENSTCEGPFLFTSTQCNGIFLDCVINADETTRRSICDGPVEKRGFEFVHRRISWEDHPDGPAANEIRPRPQRPIRN